MTTDMTFNPFGGPGSSTSAKGMIPFVGQTSISSVTPRYFGWGVTNTSPTGLWFLSPGTYSFCRVVVTSEANTADDEGYFDLLGGDPTTNPLTWTPISRVVIPAGFTGVSEREGTVTIPKSLGLVIRGSLKAGAGGSILTPHGGVEFS